MQEFVCPFYFWLGSEAEWAQLELETYELGCCQQGLIVEEDQDYE